MIVSRHNDGVQAKAGDAVRIEQNRTICLPWKLSAGGCGDIGKDMERAAASLRLITVILQEARCSVVSKLILGCWLLLAMGLHR